ncbi:hypothetical protein AB0E82_19645 [Streptomyces anulatus]|uniref:hypothetical protein n=1 Tax=Streptomyces anulatus TaxID=1892 RepID=UPI0033F2E25C
MFLLVGRGVAGVWGKGESEVGAQDVCAGLAKVVVGSVVGKAGQGVDASEPDSWGVRAELVDCLGEALGVQPGSLTVGTRLVDVLTAVPDDEGDERASPGYHAEGELHDVEKRLGVELRGCVDLLEVQQDDQAVEPCPLPGSPR